tara:strand:- start:2047 stop:2469 length:423 start_codon:yes stop_codon:yes gene_type:complete
MKHISTAKYRSSVAPLEKKIQSDFTKLIKPHQFKEIIGYHINNGGIGNDNSRYQSANKGEVSGVFDYHITSTMVRGHLYIEFKSAFAFKKKANDTYTDRFKCLSPKQAEFKKGIDGLNIPNDVFCDAYEAYLFVRKTLNF